MPHDVDGSGFFIAVFDKIGEHDENAGTLDAGDTKEICVVEGAAIAPQELSTNADGEAKADKAGGSSGGDGAAAAEEDEVVAEEQDAAMADEDTAVDVTDKDKDTPELGKARIAEGCAKMEVLHALGGNTAEAAMLTALSSYAPLFKPPDELLKAITQSYGLSAGFRCTVSLSARRKHGRCSCLRTRCSRPFGRTVMARSRWSTRACASLSARSQRACLMSIGSARTA